MALVDLEGPQQHAGAASNDKVSCHHCRQLGCCFGLQIAHFLLCFVASSVLQCHCLLSYLLFRKHIPPSLTSFLVGSWLLLPSIVLRLPWLWCFTQNLLHYTALELCTKLHMFLPPCSCPFLPALELLSCWLLAAASLHLEDSFLALVLRTKPY